MRYWVKLWTEMLDDPKMGRLTDRQHRLCTNLFCLAGIIDDNGRLLDTTDIAYKVRRDVDSVAEDLSALAAVHIVEQVDGAWHLVHFDKRNERPPSAEPEAVRERVSRYREKKRESNENVTTLQNDVTTTPENVTTMLRDVTLLDQIRSDQTREEAEQDQNQIRSEAEPEPTKSQNLPAAAALHALLALPDMDEAVARRLLDEREPAFCLAWAQYAASQGNLQNPAGYCVKGIQSGREPPSPRPKPKDPGGNGRKRSVDGKYGAYVITGDDTEDRRRFIDGQYAEIIETGLTG